MNLLQLLSGAIHVEHALWMLLLVFVASAVGLLYCFTKTNREIRSVIKDVTSILSQSKQISLEVYEEVSSRMQRSRLLAHAWHEFDETVIRDDSDEQVQVFNTKSFSYFFGKDHILEKSLHVSWYRKIPGILTSFGLLFTFLFIIFGLMEIHFEGKQVVGIDRLISGLSAKFQSSVLAILLAIAFTVYEHWLVSRIEGDYQRLIDLLDGKFNHKAGEDYLRSIDKNMRELNNSMRRFSTDLAGVIKEGLQEGMRPSTDRLLVAIENIEKQKSENIAETLAKVLQEFKASLNQSAGSEFAELASNTARLASVMNEAGERSAAVSGRMDGLVKALDDQLSKQERMSDTSMQKLHDSFAKLLGSIDESCRMQNASMKQMVEEVVNKTGSATSSLLSNVEGLNQRNATVVQGFSNLNENLGKNLDQYNRSVEATQALIKTTSEVASSVGHSLNQLASIHAKISETYAHFTQQTVIVQQIQKENVESVDKYRSVFKEVEVGLEQVLKQIGENMNRYNDLTKNGLDSYLKQYDTSLSTATTKLSSTVRDLDEVLESLNDNIETIRIVATKERAN